MGSAFEDLRGDLPCAAAPSNTPMLTITVNAVRSRMTDLNLTFRGHGNEYTA
jgi:hypothetical protein